MSNKIQSLDARIRARAHKEVKREVERAIKTLNEFCGHPYIQLPINLDANGCAKIEKDSAGNITASITVRHALEILEAHAIEKTSAERQETAVGSFISQVDSLIARLDDEVPE